MRALAILFFLAGCGGVSWNTTLADHPQVRAAMLDSVVPGRTTEMRFRTQWGSPTQVIREGAQIAYVYRNMTNPAGYRFPQFGNSNDYVVVLFQYGVSVGAYSSDIEGCRATFAPRPPGLHYPNPTTVKPVNCGVSPKDEAGERLPSDQMPVVPDDSYSPSVGGKYR